MDFTLPEAKSLVGRSVKVKSERREEIEFDGLFGFSDEGKIIGISGKYSPQGTPDISVVIQFWFQDENAIPELVIMKKDAFMRFFHLQED